MANKERIKSESLLHETKKNYLAWMLLVRLKERDKVDFYVQSFYTGFLFGKPTKERKTLSLQIILYIVYVRVKKKSFSHHKTR